MTERNLGIIEKVDVRTIWQHEASDFTPWLADNLDVLGDALGVELEFAEKEASVGGFSLDILARDANDRSVVVIENQFGTTDHDHLGKLLAYAAGFNAAKIIWVTEDFRDEHRDALDWLNRRTDEDTQFFGVAVELWKVDGSRPAPRFDLVAFPNYWTKQTKTEGNLTNRQKQYVQFWRPLLENLNAKHGWRVKTYNRNNWFGAGAGVKNFRRTMLFANNGRARVEISVNSGDQIWNETAFDLLEQRQDSIEEGMNEQMVWDRNEGAKASRISVQHSGTITDSEEKLEEIRRWMIENVEKIKTVFLPHMEDVSDEMNRSERKESEP